MPIIGRISVGDGATFTPDVTDEGVLTWTNNKNLENPDPVDIAQAVVDKKPGWGIPIGYEYFTINPNIPQGSLPLFGGEYDRATYPDLWAWVQTQTGYLKTEAQWQSLSTANAGNVPYYSDGDGSTTFRVPSLKCWVKGANGTVSEVGSYLAAGLPNITGSFSVRATSYNSSSVLSDETGSFVRSGVTTSAVDTLTQNSTTTSPLKITSINAARSSSIYGNSTTVQPPSIVGMWLVKAYGVVEDTGSIDEQQYLDDRMADLKNVYLPANYLPLSGGTMTGSIKAPANGILAANSRDDNFLVIYGGTDVASGARIGLRGKDYSDAGSFLIAARDGSMTKDLIGKPDGTLTWGGSAVVTKKAEDISSSVTVTTNNGTILAKNIYKVGNVVTGQIAIRTDSTVNVGGSITGSITGLPSALITFVVGGSYISSSYLALGISNSNSYTIRVMGANLAAGSEFAVSFIYATVS